MHDEDSLVESNVEGSSNESDSDGSASSDDTLCSDDIGSPLFSSMT